MPIVGIPPIIKRRESQNTGDIAENRVGPARGEERSVTTVVEKNENAYKNPSRQDSKRQSDPLRISPLDDANHQRHEQDVRTQSIEELPDRLSQIRFCVLRDDLVPSRFGGSDFGTSDSGELFFSRMVQC